MAIYHLLKDTAFSPEHITVMTAAFEGVCLDVHLARRDDPLRDIVAKAIIECAEAGEHDEVRLRECARKALQG